ncbi:MAG: ABC transporter ATP-binding protein/permease [Lachnospiraceae bacterium]|nr:ABC transporter ATP-binding protein/permease [Lachnospiraceae bacterium]
MLKIFKHLKGLSWPVTAIISLLIIQAYCELALPQYMSEIVDIGITQRGVPDSTPLLISQQVAAGVDFSKIQLDYLLNKGSVMLAFSVAVMLTAIAVAFLSARAGASIGRQLRDKVFKKIVSFSNAEIDRFSTASLITRSTNDIQQVQMTAIICLQMVFKAPIIGFGGVIKVAATQTGMGWIIGVALGTILMIVIILMLVAMPVFKKMPVLMDRLNLVSREILTGTNVIRAFGREKYEEKRFDTASIDLKNNQLFVSRVMALMMPLMMFIMNGITLAIVWFGTRGVDYGDLMVGDMMAFITYTMLIVMSFLMLTMISVMLPRAIVSAKRIEEILKTEATIYDEKNSHDEKLDKVEGIISFEDVSFRYPGADEDALENLQFAARPGETTAIIGSTGCGKSTLLNLIPRFYDVSAGRITLDGIDIRDITQAKLRSLIGYVPQKGVLFSGDIASNIKFAGNWISDGQMRNAAEIAQANEFINEKENHYEAEISQGGTNISGGQRQRLSIARAIAKQPKIFLFDDSFSALDYKTDIALRKALKQKTKDTTTIIVAQRINTILHANKIVVLDEGKIVGIGTHEELLKNCEAYQEIANSQFSEQELRGDKVERKALSTPECSSGFEFESAIGGDGCKNE